MLSPHLAHINIYRSRHISLHQPFTPDSNPFVPQILSYVAYFFCRTLLHVLWLKALKCYRITPITLITPILRFLHWLNTNERIECKLLSLTYKVHTTIKTSQADYTYTI